MPCLDISRLLKIEGGNLYAKDDCCEWNLIGAIAGASADVSGETYEGFEQEYGTSACGKAWAITDAIYRLGTILADQMDNDPYTAWQNCKAAMPEVQLSWQYTINAWLALADVEFLDETNPLYDPQPFDESTKQSILCKLENKLDDTATMPDKDTLFAMLDSLFESEWPLDLIVQSFWYNVMKAIGENDIRNVGISGATLVKDCACPEEQFGQTEQSAGGWYWSDAFSIPFTAKGGFDGSLVPVLRVAPHDAFGCAWFIKETGGDEFLESKRKDETDGNLGLVYDDYWYGTGSDHHAEDIWWCQVDNDIATECLALLPNAQDADPGGPTGVEGDNPASPPVVAGRTTLGTQALIALGDDEARSYGILYWRYLHNVNSPSHGA